MMASKADDRVVEQDNKAAESTAPREYHTPKLVWLGRVSDLTLAKGVTTLEAAPPGTRKKGG
jgi:hypothetical protein